MVSLSLRTEEIAVVCRFSKTYPFRLIASTAIKQNKTTWRCLFEPLRYARLPACAKWRTIDSQEAIMETEAIAEILGGRKVLGKTIKSPDELTQVVRTGLPVGSVTALAEKLHLGNRDLSRKLGIPQRTLTRRLSKASLLTPAESDRTVRMARVFANAVAMLGDRDKAIEWLGTPNRALGGGRPLDQLDTDTGSRMVEDILGRIAYGVYS
jgi:putative toxin-antitoxin system antitoxin component (TIGR02293 family)